LLMDAPTPTGIDAGYSYDQRLPASVLGSSTIWIQARLQTSGWNIMAQFNRKATTDPGHVFRFRAKLLPPTNLIITTQPTNQAVSVGGNATFSVTATGTAPLSYQWSKDGNALPGATNATLTFTNVQPPRIGDYRVVVGNGAGSVTSSVATLNIQGVDAGIWKGLVAYYPFDGNANDESGNSNNGSTVNVVASSNRFGFQNTAFLFNGVNSWVSVPPSSDFNLGGEEFSVFAWIKTRGGAYPTIANNSGTLGPTITGFELALNFPNPGNLSWVHGNSSSDWWGSGSVAIGQWAHVGVTCVSGTERLWINGVLVATRQIPRAIGNSTVALLIGAAVPGQELFDGWIDDMRIYKRGLSNSEVTALYASEAPVPPAITAQPVSQTVSASSNATFSVTATGTAPLSYQWSKDGIVLLGATNATLTLTNVQPPRIGDYRVVVGNGAGSVTSSVATLNIQGVDTGIWKGLVVYYPFNGNANDESGNQKNGTSVGATLAIDRFGVANKCYYFDGNDYIEIPDKRLLDNQQNITISAWYRFQDNQGGQIISAGDHRAGYDPFHIYIEPTRLTAVSVTDTVQNDQFPYPSLQLTNTNQVWHQLVFVLNGTNNQSTLRVYQDGQIISSTNRSSGFQITYDRDMSALIGAIEGRPFYSTPSQFWKGWLDDLRVYKRALSDSEVAALYASEAPVPPAITAQPVSQTVSVSSNATFSVAATGTAPLSYQWSKDGIVLLGATNATLTLTNVQPPMIGD